jgi:hypothetical protein
MQQIVLVVRTRRPFTRSRPSRGLLVATLAVVGLTLLLPYTPLRGPLGFVPLPPLFLAALRKLAFECPARKGGDEKCVLPEAAKIR